MIYDLANNLAQDIMCSIFDADFKPVFISKSHTNMLGYDSENFQPTHLYLLIHPDDLSLLQIKLSEMLKENKQIEITYRLKHFNGKWVTICSKCKPYYNTKKEFKYYLVTSFIKENLYKMTS